MDAPAARRSNVDDGPLAGAWLYRDFPGAEPVRVEVRYVSGCRIVVFPPRDGDPGAEVMLTDMAAYGPHWREHFERIPSG